MQIPLFKNINRLLIYCEVSIYMNYCTPQSLLNQVEMWRKEDVSRNLCVGSYQGIRVLFENINILLTY